MTWDPQTEFVLPQWAITFHSNSRNPRARKWYRVSRVVYADGGLYELYWHPSLELRGTRWSTIYARACAMNLTLLPGTYRDAPDLGPGSQLERAA